MQPLWKAVWNFLRKLKMELPFDPAIPLLGIYLKEPKTLIQKNIKHPYVNCSVIYNHQDMERAQVSISRRVNKTTMGHLHNEILLGHKKEGNFTFETVWMDLENIMLSETSLSEKDKCHMNSLICGI